MVINFWLQAHCIKKLPHPVCTEKVSISGLISLAITTIKHDNITRAHSQIFRPLQNTKMWQFRVLKKTNVNKNRLRTRVKRPETIGHLNNIKHDAFSQQYWVEKKVINNGT